MDTNVHRLGHLHLRLQHSSHLLLVVLYKSRLHHVDAVFALNLIAVMQEKRLVTRQFFLNRLNWHLINRLADLERIHG